MTNQPNYCPVCLAELPDNYPYDHAAIDMALDDRPHLYTRMRRWEKHETVNVALARGWTITALAKHLNRGGNTIQRAAQPPQPIRRHGRPDPHLTAQAA